MKFVTSMAPIAKAAADLARVAARGAGSHQPILANVKMETAGRGTILLTATDLDMTLTATVSADVEAEGAATVDAAILAKYLGVGSADIVRFELGTAQLAVQSGRSKVSLNTLPVESFPTTNGGNATSTFAVSATMLCSTLGGTAFAAADDDTRGEVLKAVRFHIAEDGSASMAATDGYVLALRPVVFTSADRGPAGEYLIPGNAAAEITRLLSKIEKGAMVEVGVVPAGDGKPSHFSVHTSDRKLTVRLVNAAYPDVDRVIPKAFDRSAIVSTKDFIGALKRSSLIDAGGSLPCVTMTVNPQSLAFDATNDLTGAAHEEIDAAVTGEALRVAFNADYLLEAAKHVETETMRLELCGPLSPMGMRPVSHDGLNDNLYIIMPLRR